MNINISGEVVRTSQLPKRIIGLGDYLVALNSSPLETSTVLVSDFVSFLNTQFATSLASLTDVSINGPLPGQALVFNGSYWVNQNLVSSLAGLSDVTIASLNPNQLLRYDGTSWKNWTPTFYSLPAGGTTLQYIDGTGALQTFPTSLPTSTVRHQVKAGVPITKGQAVYVTSADGTNMIVGLASNASEATSSKTMGLLDATVSTNGFANVVTEGLLTGLDTTGANAEGDPVWLGTGGNLIYGLVNKPYAPNHLVFIGIVTRRNANNGEIFVKVQNGFELQELHNVDALNPSNNDGIFYNSTTQLWEHKQISAVISTPTLAQVTTAGNTTTNNITIGTLFFGNGNHYLVTDNGSYAMLSSNRTLQLATSGNPVLSVFTSQNVAIGTTTDSGYKLDVNGTFRVQNNSLNTFIASAGTISGRVDSLTFNTTTNTYYGLVFTPHNLDGEIRFRSSNSGSIVGEGRVLNFSTSTTNTGYAGSTFTFTGGTTVVAGQGSGDTWNIFNINPSISTPNGGAGTYNILYIGGTVNYTGGATGIARGIYVNPTITLVPDFIGLEIAKGKVVTSSSITAASAIARGVYFNNTLVAAANNDVLVGLDINPTFTNGAFTGVTNWGLRVQNSNILLNSDKGIYFGNGGYGILGEIALGTLKFYTNSIERLNINNAGVITANGNARFASIGLTGSNIELLNGLWYFNIENDGYGLQVKNVSNVNSVPLRIFKNDNVAIGTIIDGGYKLQVAGSVRFGTGSVGTSFFWDNVNGRLGIGNSTPSYKLEVNGGAFFNENIIIANGDGIKFWVDKVRIAPATIDSLGFYTGTTAGSPLEQMRIVSNGNVLIGTSTDAGYKLDVNGTLRVVNSVRFQNEVAFYSTDGTNKFRIPAGTGWNTQINYGSWGSASIKFLDAQTGSLLLGTTTSTASVNAMLDLQSDNRGLYFNRGTIATMPNLSGNTGTPTYSIISPGSGYTDGTYTGVSATGNYFGNHVVAVTVTGGVVTNIGLWGYGTKVQIGEIFTVAAGALGAGGSGFSFTITSFSSANPGFTFYNTTTNALTYWNGTHYAVPVVSILDRVNIGSSSPADRSAILQVTSTTQGFLAPRLTTAQILAITSPAEGLQVYNTDLKTICFYNGTAWQRVTSTAM